MSNSQFTSQELQNCRSQGGDSAKLVRGINAVGRGENDKIVNADPNDKTHIRWTFLKPLFES